MNNMEFIEDGKIAFTYITEEDELKVGAETGDHEGLMEQDGFYADLYNAQFQRTDEQLQAV